MLLALPRRNRNKILQKILGSEIRIITKIERFNVATETPRLSDDFTQTRNQSENKTKMKL